MTSRTYRWATWQAFATDVYSSGWTLQFNGYDGGLVDPDVAAGTLVRTLVFVNAQATTDPYGQIQGQPQALFWTLCCNADLNQVTPDGPFLRDVPVAVGALIPGTGYETYPYDPTNPGFPRNLPYIPCPPMVDSEAKRFIEDNLDPIWNITSAPLSQAFGSTTPTLGEMTIRALFLLP